MRNNLIRNLIKLGKIAVFNKKEFKVSLLKGDYKFIIWEKSGRWCSAEEIKKIKEDLKSIVRKAQKGKALPGYSVLSEDETAFQDSIITIIYNGNKDPVAFSAQVYFYLDDLLPNSKVAHTGLSYIIPEERGKGLMRYLFIYSMVILLLISRLKPIWISSVSQVPSVIGVVADSFEDVYPHPREKVVQTPMHEKIAAAIMRNYKNAFGVNGKSSYDAKKQIIENSYCGTASHSLQKTYEETMKHRDEVVNEFCKNRLNYERGDDFLQVGKWSLSCMLKFFKSKK